MTTKLRKAIARLNKGDIGNNEENVKQKIIVPLFVELLGYERENLNFEYPVEGGRIDIYIEKYGCKIIIDTKNYDEKIDNHIEKMKDYTKKVGALLTIIANGTEIRIYHLFNGELLHLYSIKRTDINDKSSWKILSDLLHIKNLKNVLGKIDKRIQEIEKTMEKGEKFQQEYNEKTEKLKEKLDIKILEIWNKVNLPRKTVKERNPSNDLIYDKIEILLKTATSQSKSGNPAWKTYGIVPINKEHRSIFPEYKEKFTVETDIGKLETTMDNGYFPLKKFFNNHINIKHGDRIIIKTIIPKEKYKLEIQKN